MRSSTARVIVYPVFALFVVALLYAFATSHRAEKYQAEYGPGLRQALGFSHGTPYVNAGGRKVEVFTIHPVKDGFMMRAGFEDGDIVVSHRITDFYRLLHESAGQSVTITLVAGGDGPALDERPSQTLAFVVPD